MKPAAIEKKLDPAELPSEKARGSRCAAPVGAQTGPERKRTRMREREREKGNKKK